MPQFMAKIELKEEELGVFDVHFVHARSYALTNTENIPLLFLHGWPRNFTEVTKVLEPLKAAGYDVVAPSLLGFGFSSYTTKAGQAKANTSSSPATLDNGS
jgi:pimeloyl-ACP methyl ester carboxylesterase